jgi:HNH endonuclease
MTYISDALRRLVYERAEGRCEYCRLHSEDAHFPHEVDHIDAEKHGGRTDESNLGLSCFTCNRRKGSDLTSIDPETQEVVRLFHPRRNRWADHFELDGPYIRPLTVQGRVTVRLLQMNSSERLLEREVLIRAGRYP